MSEETPEFDLSQVDIRVRAQFAKDVFNRLARLLGIHFEGDIYFLSEQVDERYIRLRRTLLDIVNTRGLEEVRQEFPEELPGSLHFVQPLDADTEWEYIIQPALNAYKGKLLVFCVGLGANQTDSELLKAVLEPFDRFLDSFQEHKREEVKKFWARAAKRAEKMGAQSKGTPSLPSVLPDREWRFVDDEKVIARKVVKKAWRGIS